MKASASPGGAASPTADLRKQALRSSTTELRTARSLSPPRKNREGRSAAAAVSNYEYHFFRRVALRSPASGRRAGLPGAACSSDSPALRSRERLHAPPVHLHRKRPPRDSA
jgi:hypothetical protein